MQENRIPKFQQCIAVLWPSFLAAIVASGLFFSAFDPDNLLPFGIDPGIGRLGIYTVGFFLFWLLMAISGIGTLYFAITNCFRSKQDNDSS